MNPLRKLFLQLSKVPPALMLLIIIFMATLVTMMVTGRASQLEAERQMKSGGTMSAVVVSTCKIPAQSEIKRSMIAKKRLQEISVWQDSMTTIPNVVGRSAAKDIPANVQIREADLNY